jgi:hypothetical protein
LAAVAAANASRKAGWTGSPASPNASGSTGCPRLRRAAIASFAARVAETGIVCAKGGPAACRARTATLSAGAPNPGDAVGVNVAFTGAASE